MSNHPNATAAAITSTAIGVLVWALHRYAGVNLSVRQAVALAGGANTVVLWIGRVGLKGAARRLWHGAGAVVNGARASTATVDESPTLVEKD